MPAFYCESCGHLGRLGRYPALHAMRTCGFTLIGMEGRELVLYECRECGTPLALSLNDVEGLLFGGTLGSAHPLPVADGAVVRGLAGRRPFAREGEWTRGWHEWIDDRSRTAVVEGGLGPVATPEIHDRWYEALAWMHQLVDLASAAEMKWHPLSPIAVPPAEVRSIQLRADYELVDGEPIYDDEGKRTGRTRCLLQEVHRLSEHPLGEAHAKAVELLRGYVLERFEEILAGGGDGLASDDG